MNDNEYRELAAKAMHEDVTPDKTYDFKISASGASTTIIEPDTGWNVFLPSGVKLFYLSAAHGNEITIFDSEIDTVIALLQQARKIMSEGGE